MQSCMKIFTVLVLLVCVALGGCGSDSESASHNNLDSLKARAISASQYSCDYSCRAGDNDEVRGQLYYKEENIRFEMHGSTPDDTTVTIVNQESNQTCTYNTKMKIGEVQEPALFLLDVPLPGEVMTAMNADNASFLSQRDRNNEKCTVFLANDVQFYGYKFSGEIWVSNENGLPLYISGTRDSWPVEYEYTNLAANEISSQLFELPEGINLKYK